MGSVPTPVYHRSLKPVIEGELKRYCPFCDGGVLALRRHPDTLLLSQIDSCLLCGKQVLWLDYNELRAREEPKSEAAKLCEIIRQRHAAGKPVQQDVATHALLLIRNGWSAHKALEESEKTLDDAELEGGF